MIRKNIFIFCFIALVPLILSGCVGRPKEGDVYKIAVVAPQTGPYSLLGKSIINSAELAVNEANEKGGINGRKIVLVKEDDGGLVGEGAFFAYRLTRTEMILGVVGHLNSDISIPASFVASKKLGKVLKPYLSQGTRRKPISSEAKAAKELSRLIAEQAADMKQGYKYQKQGGTVSYDPTK